MPRDILNCQYMISQFLGIGVQSKFIKTPSQSCVRPRVIFWYINYNWCDMTINVLFERTLNVI
jgi:hypothetical protein